jgi:hypothetical protein
MAVMAKPRGTGPVAISFQGWTNFNGSIQAVFQFTNCGEAKYLCDGDLEAVEMSEGGARFAGSFACVLKGHAACTEPLAVATNLPSTPDDSAWRLSAAVFARAPRPGWQRELVSGLGQVGIHISGWDENHPAKLSFGGSLPLGLTPDPILAFTNSWIITNSSAPK